VPPRIAREGVLSNLPGSRPRGNRTAPWHVFRVHLHPLQLLRIFDTDYIVFGPAASQRSHLGDSYIPSLGMLFSTHFPLP